MPGAAAVVRLEDPPVAIAPGAVFPRALTRLAKARVHDVGVFGIELEVGCAGVLVFVENLQEAASAIGRSENAALLVRPVRMTEHGDEQPVGIPRIHDDV